LGWTDGVVGGVGMAVALVVVVDGRASSVVAVVVGYNTPPAVPVWWSDRGQRG
jgi:hypothetical protein